ncbi:MAG: ribosome small subunit-dependent GTPase A [Oscillospiraceae bacterium]|jgi:ribosome biogenesis GTPase|nr:ribosome small subunit-dependent GTPase A [Oscillospiraceae bacterium]
MNETTARVTAVHKERYELLADGETLYGKLKTSVYLNGDEPFPTVGDDVAVQLNPAGDSVILKTLPRKSYFARMDPNPRIQREQAVAANFDTVFILQSLNQNFNVRRLERTLTLAWQSGGVPVIVLTKADLTPDPYPFVRDAESVAMGVDVAVVSAKTGFGLETLSKYMQPDSVSVFLGSSGVGKSSLLNALAGETVMDVREIREDDARGRHTTTHRQMIRLPNGAYIIDTPGMREMGIQSFGTPEADDQKELRGALSEVFADVEGLTCRFSDCKHQNEPGCAVRAAIESGSLTQERWDSYIKLKREARYAEDKAAAIREKSARNQAIAMWSRNRKKEIW